VRVFVSFNLIRSCPSLQTLARHRNGKCSSLVQRIPHTGLQSSRAVPRARETLNMDTTIESWIRAEVMPHKGGVFKGFQSSPANRGDVPPGRPIERGTRSRRGSLKRTLEVMHPTHNKGIRTSTTITTTSRQYEMDGRGGRTTQLVAKECVSGFQNLSATSSYE